jgi:hypothetical protein
MKNVINITGDPIENFNININSKLYAFELMYNARFDFWTLSLSEGITPIFKAFKVVQGVDIGGIFNLDINGRLYIESISGDLSDPTSNDLGKDKRLIYDSEI